MGRAKGTGGFGQKADGTYYANLQIEGKRKWVYGKTKKEVQEKLRPLKVKAQMGAFQEPEPERREETTVEAFLRRWLATVEQQKKPRTLKSYREIVNNHLVPSIGKLSLSSLRPEQVQELIDDLARKGLKPRTVRNVRAALRQALNLALWCPQ